MDIETITKLIDAGYSKADIEAMEQNTKAAGEESAPADEEQGETVQADASAVGIPVDFGAAIENLTNTVAGLKETVKALQDANAGKAATTTAKKDTINDVMQSFIDAL